MEGVHVGGMESGGRKSPSRAQGPRRKSALPSPPSNFLRGTSLPVLPKSPPPPNI